MPLVSRKEIVTKKKLEANAPVIPKAVPPPPKPIVVDPPKRLRFDCGPLDLGENGKSLQMKFDFVSSPPQKIFSVEDRFVKYVAHELESWLEKKYRGPENAYKKFEPYSDIMDASRMALHTCPPTWFDKEQGYCNVQPRVYTYAKLFLLLQMWEKTVEGGDFLEGISIPQGNEGYFFSEFAAETIFKMLTYAVKSENRHPAGINNYAEDLDFKTCYFQSIIAWRYWRHYPEFFLWWHFATELHDQFKLGEEHTTSFAMAVKSRLELSYKLVQEDANGQPLTEFVDAEVGTDEAGIFGPAVHLLFLLDGLVIEPEEPQDDKFKRMMQLGGNISLFVTDLFTLKVYPQRNLLHKKILEHAKNAPEGVVLDPTILERLTKEFVTNWRELKTIYDEYKEEGKENVGVEGEGDEENDELKVVDLIATAAGGMLAAHMGLCCAQNVNCDVEELPIPTLP